MTSITNLIFYLCLAFGAGIQLAVGLGACAGIGPLKKPPFLCRGKPIDPSKGGVEAYLPFVFGFYFISTALSPILGLLLRSTKAVQTAAFPALAFHAAVLWLISSGRFEDLQIIDHQRRPIKATRIIHALLLIAWLNVILFAPSFF